jgi:hypothetical protein
MPFLGLARRKQSLGYHQLSSRRFGNSGGDNMATSSQTLKQKAHRELKEFLVISFYLWMVFGLFLLYKSVILNEEHIDFVAQGFAVINALALGKIMLIARALHLGEWADDAPLIYPTLIKSALFSLVLVFFKILEEALVGLHQRTFQQGIAGQKALLVPSRVT